MAHTPGTRFVVDYPGHGLHLMIQLDRSEPEIIGAVSHLEAKVLTRPPRFGGSSARFSTEDVAWARRITAEIQDHLNDGGEGTDYVSHFVDHLEALDVTMVQIAPCPA